MMLNQVKLTQVILLVCVGSIVGCKGRAIDPYEGEKSVYSMYGALEVGETPNYVRVKDLQVPFGQDGFQDLNATVRFEDLDSGISTTLEDTIIVFSGNATHNFIVNESIQPQGKYRIIAERSDGAVVQTMATAPHITKVEAEPIENVDCEQQIEFYFSNIPAPEQVQMEVGFFHEEKMHWNEVSLVDQLKRVGDTDVFYISMSPRNLLVEVFTPNLELEVDGVIGNPIPPRFLFPTVHCRELDSNVAQIRYTHFGPEWGAVEPIYPVNPDDIMDVENGLGFVGVYRQDTFSFTIDQSPPE